MVLYCHFIIYLRPFPYSFLCNVQRRVRHLNLSRLEVITQI